MSEQIFSQTTVASGLLHTFFESLHSVHPRGQLDALGPLMLSCFLVRFRVAMQAASTDGGQKLV